MSKQIVVFPRGQLSAADKKVMASAGVVAVEAETPEAVNTIAANRHIQSRMVSGDAFVMSALWALEQSPDYVCGYFVKELRRRLLAAEKSKEQQQ